MDIKKLGELYHSLCMNKVDDGELYEYEVLSSYKESSNYTQRMLLPAEVA